MKNLQMPRSYISVSEEELRSISGGGPLGDALDLFFSNLRLDDLFFSGGLISLSFTFVPMLLFNVVKTGFNFVVSAYDTIAVDALAVRGDEGRANLRKASVR